MVARLQDKLPRVFLRPLFAGILFSIGSTIFYLIFYANNIALSPQVMEFVEQADRDKSEPIIYNLQNVMFRKIQGTVDALMSFKQYYKYLTESDNLNFEDKESMKSFINKHCYNGLETYRNFTRVMDIITANNNETYLDNAIWFVNPELTKLDQLDSITLKHIYAMTNMILLLKSHYEIDKENPIKGFKNIYSGFSFSNLFYKYPIVYNSPKLLKPMDSLTNAPWCRDDNQAIPNYFYIKCRPWYRETILFKENMNLGVALTTPYKIEIITKRLGITTCIRIEDIFSQGFSNFNHFLVICIDQDISDMLYSFEFYNNQLAGYYFILRIKSPVPIYYPKMMDNFFATDIYQHEFNLNTTFYVNEVSEYKDSLDIFSANLNNTEDLKNFKNEGFFYRDNLQEKYFIYPVYLNLDDNPEVTQHVLSLIYITNKQAQSTLIIKFTKNLIPNLGFQIIMMIILGSILFLISKYLLISIALNIVKPIKLMKRLIEGMNNKKISLVNSSNFDRDEEIEEIEEEDFLIGSNEKSPFNKKRFIYSGEITDQENIEDDIEDYLGTRSQDIENLFDKLVNLKRVVSFTQDTSLNTENESILNFLLAQYTFKEVNNYKAKFLCDSNVGNLTIKCHKYDKAIFHLLESLKDPANDSITIGKHIRLSKLSSGKNMKNSFIANNNSGGRNFSENLKKSVIASYGKNFNTSDLNNLVEKSQQKAEIFKKKFLDSRYPKLIYSFKKYYKNLKKISKSKVQWENITSQDFYAVSDKHSLEQYEQILSDYCKLSNDCQEENKMVEALLEYNEFLICFKLRSPDENEITQEIKLMKTEVVKLITVNFKRVDIKLKKLKANVSNEYLKKILDMVNILKKDSIEMIEIPIHVFLQKSNYLKGKFFYYCEDYHQALIFFNESKKINIISNAQLVKKSLKKIQKIIKLFSGRIKEQIILQNEQVTIKQTLVKENLILNLKEKSEKLSKYRKEVKESIDKYTSYPKDIAILINFSNSAKNDSKKLTISLKIALNIFENLTTSSDRFCMFSYSYNSNPLINLSFKNINTVDYIKYQIENYITTELQDFESQGDDSSLIRTVSSVFDYLEKKNYCTGKIREKWIIAITDEIYEDDINFIKTNDLKEKLFDGNNNDSLIIISLHKSTNLDQIEQFNELKIKFKFNKSEIFDIDKMDQLRKKMRIFGVLNEDENFLQEKYEKSVKI